MRGRGLILFFFGLNIIIVITGRAAIYDLPAQYHYDHSSSPKMSDFQSFKIKNYPYFEAALEEHYHSKDKTGTFQAKQILCQESAHSEIKTLFSGQAPPGFLLADPYYSISPFSRSTLGYRSWNIPKLLSSYQKARGGTYQRCLETFYYVAMKEQTEYWHAIKARNASACSEPIAESNTDICTTIEKNFLYLNRFDRFFRRMKAAKGPVCANPIANNPSVERVAEILETFHKRHDHQNFLDLARSCNEAEVRKYLKSYPELISVVDSDGRPLRYVPSLASVAGSHGHPLPFVSIPSPGSTPASQACQRTVALIESRQSDFNADDLTAAIDIYRKNPSQENLNWIGTVTDHAGEMAVELTRRAQRFPQNHPLVAIFSSKNPCSHELAKVLTQKTALFATINAHQEHEILSAIANATRKWQNEIQANHTRTLEQIRHASNQEERDKIVQNFTSKTEELTAAQVRCEQTYSAIKQRPKPAIPRAAEEGVATLWQ